MTFDLRTGVTDREMSGYPEIQQGKVGLSKRLTVTMAVAFSIIIAGALLFLRNKGSLVYESAIHNSDAFPQGPVILFKIYYSKKQLLAIS